MSVASAVCCNRKIIRLLRQHKLSFCRNINFCTKTKTHYETLKISPNATHSEIKSAYYNLTLKYHPDKNQSTYAKQKFHEIANAYEVLSNYKSRKQYDRSIVLQFRNINLEKPQQSETQSDNVHPNKIYNFDAWTSAHYKYTFERTQARRDRYKTYINQERAKQGSNDKHLASLYILFGVSAIMLIIKLLTSADYDDSTSQTK